MEENREVRGERDVQICVMRFEMWIYSICIYIRAVKVNAAITCKNKCAFLTPQIWFDTFKLSAWGKGLWDGVRAGRGLRRIEGVGHSKVKKLDFG